MRRPVLIAVALVALAAPGSASAHAMLDHTSPRQGANLPEQPEKVAFYFDEPIEASFGAVRVYDSAGDPVQSGDVFRPDGDSAAIAVGLEPGLADGSYTATYRIVSTDSHPISGGFVFSIGTPTQAASVEALLEESSSGDVTSVAFWADRWLGYLAIAVALGGAVFLFGVWRPALADATSAEPERDEVDDAFTGRATRLITVATVVGLAATLLAIPLEGATAAGTTFWQALDPSDLSAVIETRFGRVMLIRAGAWIAFGLIVAAALRGPGRNLFVPGAIALGVLAITPALSGHAATQDPSWVLVPADAIHVLAVSVWAGGLVMLIWALPAATGRLAAERRTDLLVATLTRFSPLALASVIALAATGTLQTLLELDRLGDLFDTAFGRAVLIKVGLLIVLTGLGWANRHRLIPALARLVGERATPGRVGVAVRRNLRIEVVLVAAAIGVAAALVSYAPGDDEGGAPVSGRTAVGPAVLEYTVDPARLGRNQIHLYLFDAADGSQYTAARQVAVEAMEHDKGIGPLDFDARKSGPGHYVVQGAEFGVRGEWMITVTVRSSRFDQDTAEFEVPIE